MSRNVIEICSWAGKVRALGGDKMDSIDQSRERIIIVGDPRAAAVGILFVAVVLLGLQFTQAIPATSVFLILPMLFFGGAVQIVSGVMATAKGDNVIGMLFMVFGGFLMSFSVMVFGLTHAWWDVAPGSIPHAEAAFLMGWTILLTAWLLLSITMPLIFTLLLLAIDIALWALVIGIWNSSEGPQKLAGYFLLVSAVGAIYIFAGYWLEWWAGRSILPHGRALVQPPSGSSRVGH